MDDVIGGRRQAVIHSSGPTSADIHRQTPEHCRTYSVFLWSVGYKQTAKPEVRVEVKQSFFLPGGVGCHTTQQTCEAEACMKQARPARASASETSLRLDEGTALSLKPGRV
jgi:hypothetical protein